MSTDVMKERIAETSPQVYARIGGVLYLIVIVTGFCSEFFVRDKLMVSGDVTATANNITASESLWRISIAGELILLVCAVALTLILYVLLRPVNKNLALLAVFFNLVEGFAGPLSSYCNHFSAGIKRRCGRSAKIVVNWRSGSIRLRNSSFCARIFAGISVSVLRERVILG
jgi:uncharacterized protein DUF4386